MLWKKLKQIFLYPLMNIKLQGKLFVVFFSAALLPFLIMIYYSYTSIKEELTEQIYETMISTTSQISTNIENKIDYYTKISTAFYMDSTLRSYLSYDYNGTTMFIEAYQYFDNMMKNIKTLNPDVKEVSILAPNLSLPKDNVFIKSPADGDPKLSKALQGTFGNAVFLAQPAKEGRPPMFTLARLLNNYSLNYPYGILTMQILESEIYSLMEMEDGNKTMFIIDESGIILSGRDKKKLGTPISSLLGDEFPAKPAGQFKSAYGGEKALVVYTTIKNGWKTVSIIPYSSFIGKAQAGSTRFLIIALASTIIAMLLIFITAKGFTRRVDYLLNVIRLVEREKFDWPNKSMGQDEIGQISSALSKMAARIKNLINEVYKKEFAKQEMEMNVLQAQINPHFLYNTLASISSMAIKHNDSKINKMVTDLAKFYRVSLNKGKYMISIQEELTLTKYYAAIQGIRFSGLLHMHYQIDELILPKQIVKLTLQPFVENSINHAIWDDQAGIHIIIRGFETGNDINLEVIDNGMGMPRDKAEKILSESSPSNGYGIANVNRRIKMVYGDEYGVTIFSKLGVGTKVTIRIPSDSQK